MGIYYAAIDFDWREIIHPPGRFANKYPGVFHPTNPFPNMVVMKNCNGGDFEIISDMDDRYHNEWTDITDETYRQYLECFEQKGDI